MLVVNEKKISGDKEADINLLGSERDFQTGYIYLYERLMIFCTAALLHFWERTAWVCLHVLILFAEGSVEGEAFSLSFQRRLWLIALKRK